MIAHRDEKDQYHEHQRLRRWGPALRTPRKMIRISIATVTLLLVALMCAAFAMCNQPVLDVVATVLGPKDPN